MDERPEYIDSPAAWLGREMAQNPDLWIHTLNNEQVSELEEACNSFLNDGHHLGTISQNNFPLPELHEILTNIRSELQHGKGFVLLKGLPVENYSIEQCATIFCGIGAHLGIARSQNAKGHMLGHVTDVGADLSNANVRIYQTAERQSFHTDSCDCVGLLCLKAAKEGGDSLLASTVTLYNEMQKRRPDLLDILFKPIPTDRRGEIPEGQKSYFEIPVLNWYEGRLTGLYQRTYINSSQHLPEAPRLQQDQIDALDLFDEIANDPEVHLKMRLEPGDVQFVYNHTMLHDRTAFQDWSAPEGRRYLLRLWLALPDDRPLPETFKQRYGSIEIGNRGGIITKDTKLNVSLTP
ncbi:MAG: TauD/TfdA family dioxygenase [Methyloligellaceae bacterium]